MDMKFITAALLVFLMALSVEAATAALQRGAQFPPVGVLSQMKDGGSSVRFQKIDTGQGQGELFCYLYKVGNNYFLNLFRLTGAENFHSLNVVDLGDTPHSNALDISFKWLQPKHYRSPILFLYDRDFPGEWDGSWHLLAFPDGFEGRVVQQTFLEKFIGGTAINPSFDSYDERGLLVINLWDVYEGQVYSHLRLFWNGQGFGERKPRYAIVSPLFKTYVEAQNFLTRPILQASDQVMKKPFVHPSRYYEAKGLKPNYLVAILRYLDLPTDAEKVAAAMHQQNIPCSVLRLY